MHGDSLGLMDILKSVSKINMKWSSRGALSSRDESANGVEPVWQGMAVSLAAHFPIRKNLEVRLELCKYLLKLLFLVYVHFLAAGFPVATRKIGVIAF